VTLARRDDEPRAVVIDRARLDDLIRAHQRGKQGIVRPARTADPRKLEAQARLETMMSKHRRSNHLHAMEITASRFHAGTAVSGYRHPDWNRQPTMIIESGMRVERANARAMDRHTLRGANFAIGVGTMMILCAFFATLPLWATGVGALVLGVLVYLGTLTADVCRTTIPASEVEQRKIDWIVNHELPPLPDRYTCLDCGRFPEDCVCDEPEGPAKEWTEPCPAAVQAMGHAHHRCLLCNFPVQDH
jgi:hypothetical protein